MVTPMENRCLYDVFGVHRNCTTGDICSAYRKLAVERHPDKLINSSFSESEATKSFQELVNAYEILSDVKERAWYDSHRLEILFSSSNIVNLSHVPNLFSFFSNSVYSGYTDTGKGFYEVYNNVFDKIYYNELSYSKKLGLVDVVKEAPEIGNLDSPYEQVIAFYKYWLGFSTVVDFVWMDKYDVAIGSNKKCRKFMEEENKKMRRKGRREYHETVRRLAEFVKKRDKRVNDFEMKKNAEIKRKKEEMREARKEMEREQAEQDREIKEREWEKVDYFDKEDEMEKRVLNCVICFKKFKSDTQWKNHERSKKHKENLEALREVLKYEDEFVLVDEVCEEVVSSSNHFVGATIEDENEDCDNNERSTKKSMGNTKYYTEIINEEEELMKYNNKNSEKEKDKTTAEEGKCRVDHKVEISSMMKQANESDDADKPSSSLSSSKLYNIDDGQGHKGPLGRVNVSRQSRVQKLAYSRQSRAQKLADKKEVEAILKLADITRKQKGTPKDYSHVCNTCGEGFESRTKLHKHLNDTDHAALKNRRALYSLQKKYGDRVCKSGD